MEVSAIFGVKRTVLRGEARRLKAVAHRQREFELLCRLIGFVLRF